MPAKPLIAIVEDDDSLRPALIGLVRSMGYDGEGFVSAEAFLAGDCAARADCLVSDLQLPGISGLDLIEKIGDGLPAILITARTGSGQPVSGSEGLELESITAAELGGAALKGGKGTIAGTILAVILLGILTNGMTLLGVNSFWQNVAKGALLVVAVVIQQLRSGERRIGLPG